MLDKKTIDDLLENIKGEARGVVFRTDAEFVKEKMGDEGLQKIKDATKEAGIAIDYEEKSNATKWYPLSWRVISILIIQDTLGWDNEKITEMGEAAPKYSFIVRTLLRYFISLEKTFSEAEKYWKEHYSVGELIVPDPSVVNENRLVFHLKNFNIHPILCEYYKGYFLSICRIVVKAENMKIEETKCMSKGDEYHEFKVTW
ncbi:MAG: hypothetical protein PF549_00560 [Patescibacteria group bacterium]|jgi:predicted hydrocarbon binding protein|nr:hypothetical protein [Patescibacteria group bacterium]